MLWRRCSNVEATSWQRWRATSQRRYNSHFRPCHNVVTTSTTTLWQRCDNVAVPAGATLLNCILRESGINITVPKYESGILRKGAGSRFPHIASQVKGPEFTNYLVRKTHQTNQFTNAFLDTIWWAVLIFETWFSIEKRSKKFE